MEAYMFIFFWLFFFHTCKVYNMLQTAQQHIFVNKCSFRIDKYEDIILPGSNTAPTAKCRKELPVEKKHTEKSVIVKA